jgi:hypothetical protein
MHDGVTAVYKSNVDLFFCVLGAQNENEVTRELCTDLQFLLLDYSFICVADAGWCAKCSL